MKKQKQNPTNQTEKTLKSNDVLSLLKTIIDLLLYYIGYLDSFMTFLGCSSGLHFQFIYRHSLFAW